MGGPLVCTRAHTVRVGTLRRIALGAFVIGVALPVGAAPALAHENGGFSFEWGLRPGASGTTVVAGLVTNHLSLRQVDIQITATWRVGATVVATETVPAFVSDLAPHSASPFKIVEA